MNKLLIQLKREFWESRSSFVVTPFVLGAIIVGLLLLAIVPLQSKLAEGAPNLNIDLTFDLSDSNPPDRIRHLPDEGEALAITNEFLTHGFTAIYSIFYVILLLILASYFASALYNDRRDQSILFWKSLPVPEWRNVLTKLGAGAVGAPIVYAVAAVLTSAICILVILVSAALVWSIPIPTAGVVITAFVSSAVGLALGWIMIALWLLPIYSWLLFCSAAARKAPFLVAAGVPLALIVIEAMTLGSAHVAQVLKYPLQASGAAFQKMVHMPSQFGWELLSALSSPAMWLGLMISAALLAACVWLRTFKYEL